jgi:hypothetical protein
VQLQLFTGQQVTPQQDANTGPAICAAGPHSFKTRDTDGVASVVQQLGCTSVISRSEVGLLQADDVEVLLSPVLHQAV